MNEAIQYNEFNKPDTFEGSAMDFQIEKVQLKNLYTEEEINSYQIYRTDTKAYLGTVGKYYNILQPAEVYAVAKELEQMLGDGGMDIAMNQYRVVGAGERVEIAGKLPVASQPVEGDTIAYRLTVSSGNDGKAAVKIGVSALRLVCLNGMKVNRPLVNIKCRHTKGLDEKLRPQEIVDSLVKAIEGFNADLAKMAKVNIGDKQAVELLNRVLARVQKRESTPETEKTSKQSEKHRDALMELFKDHDGGAIPAIRGTAYALYNAVTNYVDHYMPIRQSASREEFVEGRGEIYKATALDEILKYAQTFGSRLQNGAAVLDEILERR